jgi:threonine aldolase
MNFKSDNIVGAIYSLAELNALKQCNLPIHMDGARFC